jgi:protein SCO1/2
MKISVLLAGLLVAGIVSGCRSAPERRYSLQAEVISVDASRGLIVVKHGEIPGLMPAMTMQYAVADPKQIETLQPGDKITAELVVSESKGRLEKIVLLSKAGVKPKGE